MFLRKHFFATSLVAGLGLGIAATASAQRVDQV